MGLPTPAPSLLMQERPLREEMCPVTSFHARSTHNAQAQCSQTPRTAQAAEVRREQVTGSPARSSAGVAEEGCWFSLCRASGAVPGSDVPARPRRDLLAFPVCLLRQFPACAPVLLLLGTSTQGTLKS